MGKKKQSPLTEISQLEHEENLFADLDAHWDMKAYTSLVTGSPMIAQTLACMVDANIDSDRILIHMRHKYPHLWPETQVLRAAARHLEAERDG